MSYLRLPVCLGTVLLASAAFAQSQSVASKTPERETIKPLLENDQIKVMEMRFKPGARTEALSHPNRFVYALTDGALVFSPPTAKPYELSFNAGEALWLPAQSTATANETGKDVRVLVVEVKARAPAPSAQRAKPGTKAKAKASERAKTGKRKEK